MTANDTRIKRDVATKAAEVPYNSLAPRPQTNPFIPANKAFAARRRWVDRIATVAMTLAFCAAMVPLVSLLWITISNGAARLFKDFPYFVTVSMSGVIGGMEAGGIYHAIVGTLVITAWATIISVPLGLMTAIYLVEYGRGRLASAIRFFVDVMTGIPSIVAGLFAAALFATLIGPAYRAGIMGAVALSVLMTPVVVRGAEEMLQSVSPELREAAYALGVPKWKVVTKVVLRTAAPGLAVTVMLAIARVIGETAPLLMTVGVLDRINYDVFDGRMMTLPVYIYRQYSQGLVPCTANATDCLATITYERAWAAALALIIIIMSINLIARVCAWLWAPAKR